MTTAASSFVEELLSYLLSGIWPFRSKVSPLSGASAVAKWQRIFAHSRHTADVGTVGIGRNNFHSVYDQTQ